MSRDIAVITGATQGLGRALATELAVRGWRLVLVARTAPDLGALAAELSARTDVHVVAADIADPNGRAAIVRAAAEFGAVTLLINNAGTLGAAPLPGVLDYPLHALRDAFEVNVIAQLALIQALRPHFVDRPTIVNVSSDAGAEAYPGWGGYGASKAALDLLTRALAVEQPTWRAFSVDPGDMRTAMHQAAFPGEDISDRPFPAASVPGFVALIDGDFPSGRYQARNVGGAP